jgi:wobble nucleotide-excising tRNase
MSKPPLNTSCEVEAVIQKINSRLKEWDEALRTKKQNPMSLDFTVSSIGGTSQGDSSISLVNGVIAAHNKSVEQFFEEAKKSRIAIDAHIVASKSRDFQLQRILDSQDLLRIDIKSKEKVVGESETMLSKKKLELADDTFILEKLNSDLHKFMGSNEITLIRNAEGGYIIERNKKIANNLSEGEKTALSLVYFVNKLGELDTKLTDTIVVLDDPISSFDSNHLFAACSYIMNHCLGARQLFLLTHNFWFFKLNRDWLLNKYNKESQVYSIKRGLISKAEPALVNHHSEYHFIFSTILGWSNCDAIDWKESFSIANSCRRLLESFYNGIEKRDREN